MTTYRRGGQHVSPRNLEVDNLHSLEKIGKTLSRIAFIFEKMGGYTYDHLKGWAEKDKETE